MTVTTFKAAKNNVSMALDGAQLAGDLTWTVQAGQGAQCPGTPFYVSCDSEVALCTLRVGDVLTVTRGQDGTAAAGHNAGALVELRAVAGLFADLATAIAALEGGNNGNPRDNQLTNGGLEVWQRGNGPFTASSVYTADRWITFRAGTDTLSVSYDASHIDAASGGCAVCVFGLGSGAGGTSLSQTLKVADGSNARARTLSASVRVKTATAAAVSLGLSSDGTGGTVHGSAAHSGSGNYETLSVSLTIPADATYVVFAIGFAASCTAYVDNAMLVFGSSPADYVPRPPADDMARCQRYYEILGDAGGGSINLTGYAPGVAALYFSLGFKAWKAVAPSVTKVGTWAIIGPGAQPSVGNVDRSGAELRQTTTGAGVATAYNATAGNNVTVEANP